MNLAELQQKLENLAQEVDSLREGLRLAFALTDTDPEMSLLRTRKVLETIIHDRYKRLVGEPGTQPLESLIQKLVKEGHFPRHLEGYADAVRKLGNVSGHAYGAHYSSEDVHRALVNLLPIVEWYMPEASTLTDASSKVQPTTAPKGEPDRKAAGEARQKQEEDSTAATGVNVATLLDAAGSSGASAMADRLCADIEKVFKMYSDREEALRFTRYHLEAEVQDADEALASFEGSKPDTTTRGKKDANSEVANAFTNIYYAREIADFKKKKRTLQAMLNELDSLSKRQVEHSEILKKLSEVAHFYLR